MADESVGGIGGGADVGGLGGADRAADRAADVDAATPVDRAEVARAANDTTGDEVHAQAEAVAGAAAADDSFERADRARPQTAAEATAQKADQSADQPADQPPNAQIDRPPEPHFDEPPEQEHPALTINGQPVTPPPPARTPSEGTLAEIARRETLELDRVAGRVAAGSPTASGLLNAFRTAGGRFEPSPRGAYFRDGATPVIGVPAGSDEARMRTIAHELGHFDFRNNPLRNYVPPGNPPGLTDHQIEQRREHGYVVANGSRGLLDEGNAAIVNNRIRNELRAATGLDIGVSGDSPARPMPLDPSMPLAQQRQVLADFFGDHLSTSTTNQNYRAYYNQPFIDFYRSHLMPGAR